MTSRRGFLGSLAAVVSGVLGTRRFPVHEAPSVVPVPLSSDPVVVNRVLFDKPIHMLAGDTLRVTMEIEPGVMRIVQATALRNLTIEEDFLREIAKGNIPFAPSDLVARFSDEPVDTHQS